MMGLYLSVGCLFLLSPLKGHHLGLGEYEALRLGFSQSIICKIANCSGESWTAMFDHQLSDIMFAAKGAFTFKSCRYLHFSKDSKVNLDSLDVAAVKFRKRFPKQFWDQTIVQTMLLNTTPNENRKIWFEDVFVYIDNKKKINIVAAIRVLFAGTDATKERIAPKIQDIVLITDQALLKKYATVIPQLMKANNIQDFPEKQSVDDGPPPPIMN